MKRKLLEKNEEQFQKRIFSIRGLNQKEINKFINAPNGKLIALPKSTWEDRFEALELDRKNPFMIMISNVIIHVRKVRVGPTPKHYTYAGKLMRVQDCYLLTLGRRAKGVIVE